MGLSLLDVLGPAVQAALRPVVRVYVDAELGGDDDLLAEGRERLAHEILVGVRPVDLRGVEEGDAALEGGANQGDRLLPVGGGGP